LRYEIEGLSEVARRLDCRYAVTGNLQLSDERMRVRVQLQNTDDGRVIWSDRFTGHIGDVFAFQEEITEQVVARLAPQIREEEWRRVQDGHIPAICAYDLVLRGQNLSQRYSRESNLHAFKLFENASFIDPRYGRSYAGISRTFNLAWRYRWHQDPEDCLRKAVELAQLAVKNDPMDARAHDESGFAHLYLKQHGNAVSAYERALELNCNDADIIAEFGDALVYDERPEEAVEYLERAMRLNPLFPDWYLWNLADAYNAMKSPEKVIATVQKMREVADGRRLLVANYAHLGMLDEAAWHASELLREQPDFSIANWSKRPPYKNREQLDHYMDGLRRAGLPEK
jgi:tetratricopeptide (TPR) repeat protein